MSDGQIREFDRKIVFSLQFPGFTFAGQIQKVVSPIAIEDGLLYRDVISGESNYWIIPIPYGNFEVQVSDSSSQRLLKGIAYHDHNWGSVPLQGFVREWVWGHFCHNGKLFIFLSFITSRGLLIHRGAYTQADNKICTTTSLHSNAFKVLSEASIPSQLTASIQIDFSESPLSIIYPVSNDRLLRSRENESHDNFVASYYRWASNGLNSSSEDNSALQGITEYLRIKGR
ncbi:MAG: hypothetical protein MUO58_07335 [Anaerolineales bacterium]|nr:hypothetical protein [Anaerolineales bacterium]